ETDKTFCAQPPAVHRVENSARRVVGEIHKRTRLERVRKAALKDERQIEADDVVAHELVAIAIEVLHEVQKILKRLHLVFFVAVPIDAKHVLARFDGETGNLKTRNSADVQRDAKHAA